MTEQQILELANKVADGLATPEEELTLLQEMNKGVEILRSTLTSIKNENK